MLVLGADGFIGRHIAAGLRLAGWDVLAHARRPERLAQMGFRTLKVDLARPEAADPDFWRLKLSGVTHLVNAAGVLNAPEPVYRAVHVEAPAAIYACLPHGANGVLISAVGIEADTAFARHRRDGEDIARRHDLSILRAGLVLGETSYGGSSLARALAALPLRTPVVGDGQQRFNPIHAHDLAQVVAHLLLVPDTSGPLDAGGAETVTQEQMLGRLRAWMGLPPQKVLHLPLPLARLLGRMGDIMQLGPISRTAVDQLQSGVLARTAPAIRALDPPPRGFQNFLNARPAGTQDLWHARLYLLRPVLRIVLALMWAASGLIGLLLPPEAFLPLVTAPLPDEALVGMARTGGIVDLGIAVLLLRGWRPRLMARLQLAVVTGYTVAFTLLAPGLWLLPLGGLLKNLPILVLLWVSAILEEER